MNNLSRTSKATVDQLRRQIAALEETEGHGAAVTLGLSTLDAALPWGGLPRGALHEVTGAPGDGAALGFALMVLARLGTARPVLWCRSQSAIADHGVLYGPGLAAAGINPRRVIFVTVSRNADALWVLEEGLRCHALSAVIGEGVAIDFTASRRLQLAARDGQALTLLLPTVMTSTNPTAALTRWQITSAGAPYRVVPGRASWRVALQQCRGGRPQVWKVETNHAALCSAVAMPLADGSMEAVPTCAVTG